MNLVVTSERTVIVQNSGYPVAPEWQRGGLSVRMRADFLIGKTKTA